MSQFATANRWRKMPVEAWTNPTPSRTPAHWTSFALSLGRIPWSIAFPMMAGITAWETIHTTPKTVPPAMVDFCWPAIQSR